MNVADALRDAATRLGRITDTARLDAELLMAHALQVIRSELLLHHMRKEAPAHYADLIARRCAYEPVAYIVGKQEFRGLELLVNRAVLIPRADSEATLEAALEARPQAARILDCGTGSGALLIALLDAMPEATGIGMDASRAALAVAAANAARHGQAERARLLHGDWNQAGWADDLGEFDLVIANPPYVENNARLPRDVHDHEPHSALFAGPDGLDDYRILIPQLRSLLVPDGAGVLEIGASQADAVIALGQENGFTASLRHDLAGRARSVILQ